MTDRMSSQQFYASAGVEDWRVIWGGGWACAQFRTGSFGAGVALVRAIGELAVAADRQPDVDLRPEGVTVRLFSEQYEGVTEPDVELARQISAAARELGAPADPAAVQHVQVAIDALDIAQVRPFWRVVLGYAEVGDEDVLDPLRRGPSFWFQQMDAARPLPHRRVRAARPGAGADRGCAGGRRPDCQRRERAGVVDPRRPRGQRGRPGHLGVARRARRSGADGQPDRHDVP